MRLAESGGKTYFAVGVGAGVEPAGAGDVAGSILRTSPAGVRSASIGVVSGVGGGVVGAAACVAWPLLSALPPQPVDANAPRASERPASRTSFILS